MPSSASKHVEANRTGNNLASMYTDELSYMNEIYMFLSKDKGLFRIKSQKKTNNCPREKRKNT